MFIDQPIARLAAAAQGDPVSALTELLPLDDRRRAEGQLWLVIVGWSGTDPMLAGKLTKITSMFDGTCARSSPGSSRASPRTTTGFVI